jgi:hypothetical protein
VHGDADIPHPAHRLPPLRQILLVSCTRADAADITHQADAAAAADEGERRNGVAREKMVVADLLRVVDSQALHITLTLTVT